MKNRFSITLLSVLLACSSKESQKSTPENILENISFQVDTVIVDAGDDFFNLQYGLGASKISEDKSKLYFFENDPPKLVEVDLNQLKLVKKNAFEKEGPNGIGPYLIGMELGKTGHLFLQSFNSAGLFNQEGQLLENLKIKPTNIDQELAENYQKLYGRALYNFDRNLIYSSLTEEKGNSKKLATIHVKEETAWFQEIPKMDANANYTGTYKVTNSGGGMMVRYFGPSDYTYIENGKLFISAGSMSGFYTMGLQEDSIEFIDVQHKTVPNRWNITVQNESPDESTFLEDRRKVNEQLNFMDLKYDEKREMYFRFGKRTFLGEQQGDPSTYEIYLFAYDKDFHVVGETHLENLEKVPSSYFWKNGQLWSYVNVDDELGFEVFTFNF